MDFFISLTLSKAENNPTIPIKPFDEYCSQKDTLYITHDKKENRIKTIRFENGICLFLGDPIYEESANPEIVKYLEKRNIGEIIHSVQGFYYFIIIYNNQNRIIIGNSLFSILPIYYTSNNGQLGVSSTIDHLLTYSDQSSTDDRQYYLEKALLNYPLFNRTPFEEIKTIQTNNYLEYNYGTSFFKEHTKIYDYFTDSPKPWRKSIGELSDLFLNIAGKFFPQNKFYASFTGGFDGRTIIAIALQQNKEFDCYSYGLMGDSDVDIPANICKNLDINYLPVILDEDFAKNHYWNNANEFLIKSNGLGNLSRSHYHYVLKKELNEHNYLITGNFGSEIIRAMKVPGVMISSVLFSVFEGKKDKDLLNEMLAYPGIKYLNHDLVIELLEKLLNDIKSYIDSLPSELTSNQKFYVYLYEEVFRKYFGPEIIIQKNFIFNRSPYLNFDFIKALLKTELAGANSAYKETNPFKRYHGQVLYAHILKKSYPKLVDFDLDRQYKPRDFLTFAGPMNIAFGYYKRKYLHKKDKSIPSYSKSVLNHSIEKFKKIQLDSTIFNNHYYKLINSGNWEYDQLNFINIASAAHYQSIIHE